MSEVILFLDILLITKSVCSTTCQNSQNSRNNKTMNGLGLVLTLYFLRVWYTQNTTIRPHITIYYRLVHIVCQQLFTINLHYTHSKLNASFVLAREGHKKLIFSFWWSENLRNYIHMIWYWYRTGGTFQKFWS